MQVEITAFIEDYDIINYVSQSQQAKVLSNIFNECCENSKIKFINSLDDDYLVKELESRDYMIIKAEK